MAQVPSTDVSFVGDGLTSIYDFTFPYLKQEEVFVSVDGVNVTFDWLSNSSVQLHAVPADGAVVIVYRNTDADDVRYLFNGGVPLKPAYIDANARQLLYALQEGINSFADVGDAAADAQQAAQNAQVAAESASNAAFAAAASLTRSLRVPSTDPELPILPDVASRANKLLAFDGLGNPTVSAPSAGSAEALAIDLANQVAVDKGAALIGFNGGTVRDRLISLQNQIDSIGPATSGGYRTLASFNVVGDGVTDDTAAMQNVAAYNGYVVGQGMTVLCDQLDFTGACKLDMQGGTIKVKSVFQRFDILSDGVELRNAIIDVQNKNVNVALFRITAGYTDYVFENLIIQNITGIAGSANQYAFYVDADDTVGTFRNVWCRNISNVSAGTPTSGFCGGWLISAGAAGAKRLDILNCTAENVFNTNYAGNINNTDADGLRLFGPVTNVNSNVFISDFCAINCMKSGIKVSGHKGITVQGVKVYNDRSDIGMVAGVRFQSSDDSVISNVTLLGRMSTGINLNGRNIQVNGLSYAPIDPARDYVESGLVQVQSLDTKTTADIRVSNVNGTNVGCVFDLDNSGTTLNTVFNRIVFSNWHVTGRSVASSGVESRIRKAVDVVLDGVRIFDPSGSWLNLIDVYSSATIRVLNSRLACRRQTMVFTSDAITVADLEFVNTLFWRHSSANADNLAVMNMRNSTDSANLDRVSFKNCRFSVPTYSAIGNQHCITARTTNSIYQGIDILVRNEGDGNPPTGYISLGSGSVGNLIQGISVTVLATLAGGGGYAVDLASGAVWNVISGVRSGAPGVRLLAGANNNVVDAIIGKTTAINNAGTGNQLGQSVATL